jgi:SAM-dependent methyltransferase
MKENLAVSEEETGAVTKYGGYGHHCYVLDSIKALLPPAGNLRILDAGSGHGWQAGQLAALGHRVTGIDKWPEKIDISRKAHPEVRFELASVYDSLSAFMPRGGWDVIVASEVIEHLYSPQGFLRNMHVHLRPTGCIIVTTPYHGWLKNVFIGLLGRWDWHHQSGREGGHVKFFSVATLGRLLVETGFGKPVFRNAGRLPWLWKSMACRADRLPFPRRRQGVADGD